ncbi:CDP-alcohol phosphatidyltransferase family protein [Parapedobacter defluvii]|uniref:CDP-alcohol phosphatidyltransferase family protein n=1 Tax=Parapedobacter defluvii TaxID=2045106 RepID=UPI003341BBE9
MLTAIGFFGSLLIMASFIMATYGVRSWLILGVLGFVINWYGDSLDGRIAYYRNTPRKWFGFSLDIVVDWVGTAVIGIGYLVYAKGYAEFSAYLLVVLYGWALIISQLRYKITDKYQIDAGLFGPTEMRVLISLILVCEVLIPGTMRYAVWFLCVVLFAVDLADTRKLLRLGDERDRAEQ